LYKTESNLRTFYNTVVTVLAKLVQIPENFV